MATEYDQVLIARQNAKKSVIGNAIGFSAGLLITLLTLMSPSPIFILAWGALIFCPISAARSYSRYKKLGALVPPGMP